MHYKILHHSTLYEGFFRLDKLKFEHEKFAGGMVKPQIREVLERGEAAAVIPYDPVRDEVIWIEQFRVGALTAKLDPWLTETVAGIVETGESPVDVIYREAVEEAGCQIQEIEKITSYLVSPGITSEIVHLYCGKTNTSSIARYHGLEHEGEDIKAHVLSFAESVKWYRQGRFNSAMPMLAIQWLMLNRDRLRARWV